MFERLINSVVEWVKRPRSLLWIGISAVIAIIGQLLEGVEVLEPMRGLTNEFREALSSIDVSRLFNLFYYRMTGCTVNFTDVDVLCSGIDVTQRFESWNPLVLVILGPLDAFYFTGASLFEEASTLALVLFVGSCLAAGIWLYDLLDAEDNWLNFGFFLLLTPAAGAALALALKFLLILIALVFSQVLGAVIWIIAIGAAVFKWAGIALSVFDRAEKLQQGAGFFKGKDPGPKP